MILAAISPVLATLYDLGCVLVNNRFMSSDNDAIWNSISVMTLNSSMYSWRSSRGTGSTSIHRASRIGDDSVMFTEEEEPEVETFRLSGWEGEFPDKWFR